MGDVGEIEVGCEAAITYHQDKTCRKVMKCLYIAGGRPYDFWEFAPDFWFVEESDFWGKVKWA